MLRRSEFVLAQGLEVRSRATAFVLVIMFNLHSQLFKVLGKEGSDFCFERVHRRRRSPGEHEARALPLRLRRNDVSA
jgi:hypothetical protein